MALRACVDLKNLVSNWPFGLASASKFYPRIGPSGLHQPQKFSLKLALRACVNLKNFGRGEAGILESIWNPEYSKRIGGVEPSKGGALMRRRTSTRKHSSDQDETLPKRVLDDPRQINFWPKKIFSPRFFGLENRFRPFWCNFGGSTEKRTSMANSSQIFALDAPILTPVRPKNLRIMSVGAPRSGSK